MNNDELRLVCHVIIMIESGRLGNQIFQYLALRHCASEQERIWLLGFDQLNDVFTGIDARFTSIHGNPLRHLQSIDSNTLANIARMIPSASLITEDEHGSPLASDHTKLRFASSSWFQNAQLLENAAVDPLNVREHWLARARSSLGGAELDPRFTAFVHARAGDYRTWPSADFPAVLDLAWYADQAEALSREFPGLRFAVIGDEPGYRSEVAAAIPNSVEIDAGFETEFALMTLCHSGVLSASTYALWGAFFAKRAHSEGRFIAPQYWAGHRRGEWYPSAIQTDFLTYA